MTRASRESLRRAQQAFEDLEFRFDPAHRVALPQEEEIAFEEEQPFDQVWLWALMGFEILLTLILLFATGLAWREALPVLAVMALPLGLLSAIRLRTRIDDEGIHFRMRPFHWKMQTIPWEEIDHVYVRKYSPVKEYGGWGVRFGPSGKAFNVKGNHGIQVVRKNGRKVLVGTQHPEAAAEALGRRLLLV